MMTKFDIGDDVYLKGKIRRIEIIESVENKPLIRYRIDFDGVGGRLVDLDEDMVYERCLHRYRPVISQYEGR